MANVRGNLLCVAIVLLTQDAAMSKAAIATSYGNTNTVTTHCEYYNHTMCTESKENGLAHQTGCREMEECEAPSTGKRNHCYVLLQEDENGTVTTKLKGCFLNNEDCYNKSDCIAKKIKQDYFFCCCEGNMCNKNFTYVSEPNVITESPAIQAPKEPVPQPKQSLNTIICISILTILAFIAFGSVFYWFYTKNKHMFNELPTMEPNPMPPPSPLLGARPIQLVEVKARGRFGAVWKANLKTEEVAVKIFPMQDKQSWLAEQEIFKLPHMEHPNVLHYIGVEKRGGQSENGHHLQAEFWLITAYHERGSLCDFLKANTVTWYQLCRIVETMARGLMHLHEELPSKHGELAKPAIAHRDFKSKNVLLKHDMTACIADFGLALVFVSGKSCGDTHGQVGTRRYMAPEVLEGAINFTPDAFLRIDMYACGLVLWELVSRCIATGGALTSQSITAPPTLTQSPPSLLNHHHHNNNNNNNVNSTTAGHNNTLVSHNNTLVNHNNSLVGHNNTLVSHNNTLVNHNNSLNNSLVHNNGLAQQQQHNNSNNSNNSNNAVLTLNNKSCVGGLLPQQQMVVSVTNSINTSLNGIVGGGGGGGGNGGGGGGGNVLIGGAVAEYRLPFEDEVGQHPTLEDMQEAVVQRKVRPAICEHWRNHPGLSSLCDTMEECWDHDAEARLSASCVMERVMLQSRYQYSTLGIRIENDSPTKENTISM